MRRSAVEEYLNATQERGPPQRAPPPVPGWAERVQQEGLRPPTVQEMRQAYGRTSEEFRRQQTERAATNSRSADDLLRAYRERVGVNPTASFRSAAAPQQQERVPQPYAGVGVGERLDPAGGEDRESQPYAGAPAGRFNPYEGVGYPPAGTGPPRGPGGAPQAEQAPEAQQAPFENADEQVPQGAEPPAQEQQQEEEQEQDFQYNEIRIPLPPPFNSPEAIRAKFGENPNRPLIRRVVGLTFHPDKGGNEEQFKYAIMAVNNAYGRKLFGQGKRRKYRY